MRIGFIGAGQMARALANGFLTAQLASAEEIIASDPASQSRTSFAQAVPNATITDDNLEVITESDVVFLAVKPQHMPNVFSDISAEGSVECLFVSIAAGVTIRQLTTGLGSQRVIRVMPNTPCLIGQGAAGYSRATGASDEDASIVERLLSAVGRCWELPEALLDAVTGLSGSGPAFTYTFIEALSDGGVLMGLPRDVATQLAAQTVAGAAEMVLQTGEHPGVLKDRVCSPGGTTIVGVQALEAHGFRGATAQAVQEATRRSRELGAS